MKRYVRHITVFLSPFFLNACANFSAGNLFSHYSAQNGAVYQSVKSGQYQDAENELAEFVAGDILDNLEKGRVHFLNQNYVDSKRSFELSDSAVKIQQDKALISLSDTATSVGALAVNDNLMEYVPADYELGFLHLYLGLNYLQQNDLDGALVEVRRANQVQEQARQAREAELEKAQKELKSQGVTPNLGSVLANYPDAGKALQAVQNGYLFYLSALLYEASGDVNSAYVDYRRALAVTPDNIEVIEGTLRVAKRLGMREDLIQLEKRYGKSHSLTASQGRVLIIEEQSVVKALDSWRQSLPLYDSRGNGALYSLALPYYPNTPVESFSSLTMNDKVLTSHFLTDVNLMASRNLSEKMPSIVIRQALRVLAKDQLRKEAAKDDNVGNLVFNVWNLLTEQPDTRSWLTLPGLVQTASLQVNAGEQRIKVGEQEYQFSVPEKGTTLVWVSRQGRHSTIWHKQLGRL